MPTEVSWVQQVAESQAVWAILFIGLLVVVYKFIMKHITNLGNESQRRESKLEALYEKQKEESLDRERRLMDHLEKTTEALTGIQKGLEGLEDKVETGFAEVWDQLKHNGNEGGAK